MITCQIRWIDTKGNETPDDNPATCIVTCKSIAGGSKSFFCCEEHRKRAMGFSNWEIHDPQNFSQEFVTVK